MLFHSQEFLFIFLPVVLLVYLGLARSRWSRWCIPWVIVCSLAFYTHWNPAHLWVIVVSVVGNYILGCLQSIEERVWMRRLILTVSVSANLGLLIYFKYAGFLFAGAIDPETGQFWRSITSFLLPVGISFYTLQQVGFQFDCFRSRVRYSFEQYAFFVTFFPQLISGPIVYHSEIIPQTEKIRRRLRNKGYVVSYFAPGLALFVIGLGKKVLLADTFAKFADLGFDTAAQGHVTVGFIEAWGSAAAFALQIYFDFSAYSDMAIGIAMLFGLKLPVNFNSPYKARSLIEFWQRWHITLTRFLTAYVFTPVSFSLARSAHRSGRSRTEQFLLAAVIPLFFTMLLSGIWHGAGWTFILFGLAHGVLISANHAMRRWSSWTPPHWLGVGVTLFILVVTLLTFRAPSLDVALSMYSSMFGAHGIGIPHKYAFVIEYLGPLADWLNIHTAQVFALQSWRQPVIIILGFVIVLTCPNGMSLLTSSGRRKYMASPAFALWGGFVATTSLLQVLVVDAKTFAYFQF